MPELEICEADESCWIGEQFGRRELHHSHCEDFFEFGSLFVAVSQC